MARKKIYDEDLRLNLIINGEGLKKGNRAVVAELGKQERKMRELEMQIIQTEKAHKKAVQTYGARSVQAKKLSKMLRALKQEERAQRVELENLRKEAGLAGMTLQQLKNHVKALKVELHNARGDKAFSNKLRTEIRATEMEITRLTTGAGRMAQMWERLALKANRFGTIMGYVMISFYMFWRGIGRVVYRMKDLEDRIGGVRKLAGLTRDEVWELKDAFDEMGSRTPTDKLLDMAKIAGRLGQKGKDNILKFVSAADKIAVALKESLGDDVEEIMRKMGKLVNVFRLTDDMTMESALLRIGSVLNELDKRSAASADTILEYTYRLSSYAQVVNMSAADVMGLAAALDALGVRSEMGATQVLKLLRGMGKAENAERFAKMMGLTVDEYERMLENDPNEMFLKLVEALSEGKNNMIEMEELMKQYGVDGQRIIQVLGPIINNIDKVREQQAIANEEFKKGTSVLLEYEIMNRTFGAEIDKQNKRIRALADHLYKKLQPAVLTIYIGFVDFLVVMKEFKIWLVDHATIIKTLIALYIALKLPRLYHFNLTVTQIVQEKYLAFIKWKNITLTKLEILWTGKLTVAQKRLLLSNNALRAAYYLMTGQFGKLIKFLRGITIAQASYTTATNTAAAATKALYATMGAIVLTIAAIGTAIYFLTRKTKEQSRAQKELAEMNREMLQQYGEEKADLDILYKRYEKAEDKQKARKDLIQALNRDYSTYLGYTIDETNNMFDLAKAYNDVSTAMRTKIELELMQAKAKKVYGEMEVLRPQIEAKQAKYNEQKSINTQMEREGIDPGVTGYSVVNRLKNELDELKGLYGEYETIYDGLIDSIDKRTKTIQEKWSTLTLTDGDSEFDNDLKLIESKHKEKLTLLTEQAVREKKTTEWLNKEKHSENVRYLREKLDLEQNSADKEEDAMDTRLQLANEFWNQMNKTEKNGNDALLEAREGIFDGMIAREKQRYIDGEIDKKEHDRTIMRLEIAKLEAIIKMREEFGMEVTDQQIKLADLEKKYGEMLVGERLEEFERLKKAAEEAHAQDVLSLTQRYDEEEGVRENFQQKMLESELALLTLLRSFRLQYGLDTLSIDQQIADKEKEIYDNRAQNAEDFTKDLNKRLGRRNRNYLTKFIAYNKEIEATENDTMLSAEDRQKKIEFLKQELTELNEAEALSFAQSAQNAVESAETFQEATAAILNSIRDRISAYMAEAVAGAIAKEIGSKGLLGIITAGLAAAAVTMLFNTLIPKFGTDDSGNITTTRLKPTQQRARGQYPVIGEEDGLLYNATYRGPVRTGIYSSPTLLNMAGGRTLVGETKLPELVIDGKTFKSMQMNAPQLVRDIYAMAGAVPQRASGQYPEISGSKSKTDERIEYLILENKAIMNALMNLRVVASIEEISTKEKQRKKMEIENGL